MKECPSQLDCGPDGAEVREGECCPTCKNSMKCVDVANEQKVHNSGDYWVDEREPCMHCSCNGTKISCFRESCDERLKCAQDEILVSKSNRCCPECESRRLSDNCEYYGKSYLNGEMWYTKKCQHCACNAGKVTCMSVECESKFCLKSEIMVRKKNDCCMECRKPIECRIDEEGLVLQVIFVAYVLAIFLYYSILSVLRFLGLIFGKEFDNFFILMSKIYFSILRNKISVC